MIRTKTTTTKKNLLLPFFFVLGGTLLLSMVTATTTTTMVYAQTTTDEGGGSASAGGLSASIAKDNYNAGDVVVINGTVAKYTPTSIVIIEVIDPKGRVVEEGRPHVSGGKFRFTFTAGENVQFDPNHWMLLSGDYTVEVRYTPPSIGTLPDREQVELHFNYNNGAASTSTTTTTANTEQEQQPLPPSLPPASPPTTFPPLSSPPQQEQNTTTTSPPAAQDLSTNTTDATTPVPPGAAATNATNATTTNTTTTGGGGGEGTMFTELENYGHNTGFSIYVPGGDWVIDSFSDGDGRMQTEEFAAVPAVSPEFEVAASLCEVTSDRLSSVSPTTGKTYYCGAFGSLAGLNDIHVRMYQTFGMNPLNYHLSLLDYNTFYNANKRVINITDTTVDLVDSTTNQTIQQIPAKIANIILLRNDPSSIRLFDYIDTVLYTTDTEMTDGYSYVVTFKRDMPGEFDSGDSKARIAATDAIAKVIFDSFRILSK